MIKTIQASLIGIILITSSFLLGSFFTHWVVDHNTIWRSTILEKSVRSSLVYYAHVAAAPAWYLGTLTTLWALALGSAALRTVTGGSSGILFGGASFMLLLSALSVYVANVTAALEYLPLTNLPSADSPLDIHLTEALQSLAASHMIIAVSLTGVLSLQGAARYSDRPTPALETKVIVTS